MDGIAQKVFVAINDTVVSLGYEIVDVEYLKKKGDQHLTVFIYKKEGITLDDCERVHHAIDPIIDEVNPSGDAAYFLNVSSPGLDRPFKTQRDFERNYGLEVEVKLFAPLMGKKIYEGTLVNKAPNTITLKIADQEKTIETTKIAYVRPLVKFE